MKQTFNVNIGGRAYNIDHDAYGLLDRYLKDIASRLPEGDGDSMEDIEARMAEIFDKRISSTMQVVNIDMVRRAMAEIGRPEDFGTLRPEFSYAEPQPKRLYRSSEHRVFGGVCGGLAEYFNVDPVAVRVAAVLLFLIPPFPFVLAYIIMCIVVPSDKQRAK